MTRSPLPMSGRRLPRRTAVALAAAAVALGLPAAADLRGTSDPAAPVERLTSSVEASAADGTAVFTRETVEDVSAGAARLVSSRVVAGAATAAHDTTAAYAFTSRNSVGVAHWNRCTPVRYWVNPSGLPTGALAEVHAAMKKLAVSSGLRLTYAGATKVLPLRSGWTGTVPSTLRSDIFIAWSDERAVPSLAGSVAGLGGAASVTPSRREPRLVLGGVVIDRAARVTPGFGTGTTRGALLLHELGHAVNLTHVADSRQTMYASITPASRGDYQAGDRAGLAALGRLGCF